MKINNHPNPINIHGVHAGLIFIKKLLANLFLQAEEVALSIGHD
jgi:hypothetical protein